MKKCSKFKKGDQVKLTKTALRRVKASRLLRRSLLPQDCSKAGEVEGVVGGHSRIDAVVVKFTKDGVHVAFHPNDLKIV